MSSTQQPLFRIGKSFRFEATRRLDGGTYDGHSFTAEAVLTSMRLTPEGFVADFGDLAPLKRYIDGTLDHQVLNDYVEDVSNEGLARHLLGWAKSHLPADVVSVLEDVRVRTGRPQALPSAAFASFEASHQLHGLRDGHPCGRLHGHSYMLSVPVSAVPRLGDVPVLLRNHLRSAIHGKVLNQVIPGLNPTSENLAQYFSQWLTDRAMGGPGWDGTCVRISETETSWAEYMGGPA
ncbi:MULTISPECIES: 6-pyruvoyl trahydropterin synthase family protein [Streptomyces]|uniref:6-carboxy-5,6,7,8-tetrahydropterin synthase n=1 Tax=Streptomyces venezuelae (strain ATCC 10712 / CBS 650.69 / DSM 40230 / JCM 4526 / NBRC 13096 / PD 04745) TaxID=953739 RepID=F2R9E9_STRVP|nr:6-carboxytetrahydropterin synthase [Streptomyces venezuelae]APE24532.1 6-pyruvoyl tetrahydropterin synthase [Streptomyces venezuelae]QES01891.1 6-pyruvoyl tetrahydropterin synthase [Streptomyces venezuelae ATCC 10712]CCA58992.1 Queuosine biosynthesis QueD, PTPS-I [Streptomyces venezuelae ATCC 10712]